MVVSSGLGRNKSNASIEARPKKLNLSKTSIGSQMSNDDKIKRPKTASASEGLKTKRNIKVRPKTADETNATDQIKSQMVKFEFPNSKKKGDKKSETSLKKKTELEDGSEKSIETEIFQNEELRAESCFRVDSKGSVTKRASQHSSFSTGSRTQHNKKIGKPSEIPKLKPLKNPKTNHIPSKLPVKVSAKETEPNAEPKPEPKQKPEPKSTEPGRMKSGKDKKETALSKEKKEIKVDEKVKTVLSDDLTNLVPLYESELQKITDIWVNTIYCSLTMRTNLVKLLFQAFPDVDRSQFDTEDENLLHSIDQAKSYTKTETDGLVHFIRNLSTNREKTKERLETAKANKEIAEVYNHDWRKLSRKITQTGEEAKQFQTEAPDLQKKKELIEFAQKEKIRMLEANLASKDEELVKLENQLNILKQKELSYKGNILMKVQDYKDIKADVQTLKNMEKEFDELKAKYMFQNEMYEKKIKDLEFLLDEKKKIHEKQKKVKSQLQNFLSELESKKKKIMVAMGREQFEYVLGRTHVERNKRREQLWLAAVKLVLKGFLIQMKKLEKDRNKMLLELQSDDCENFTALATSIFRQDNFIKSIKQQVNGFQKACEFKNEQNNELSCIRNLKSIR